MTMGSALGSKLAIIFLYYHVSNWLKHCSKDFEPVYYKTYSVGIFVLFNKPEYARFFLEYVNKNIRA